MFLDQLFITAMGLGAYHKVRHVVFGQF